MIANSSDALDLTLVDGDRLSETPTFYQIIGCHLQVFTRVYIVTSCCVVNLDVDVL